MFGVPVVAELSKCKPYTVTRSANHMLPVYLKVKERKRREQTHGKRMLTVVTKVGGDLSVGFSSLSVYVLQNLDPTSRCMYIKNNGILYTQYPLTT